MSGRERVVPRRWSPPPSPLALDHRRPAAAAGSGTRPAARSLPVAPAGDAAEAQADSIAASVAVGMPVHGDVGRPRAAGPALQRQPSGPPPGPEPDPKVAEKQLAELKKTILAEAVKIEPLKGLVAQGKELLATPAGKVALAEAILGAITVSVLAKQELPLTTWTQDLGDLHSSLAGVSAKITWEGPANKPTKAGLDLTVTSPQAEPGLSATVGGQGGATAPPQLRSGISYSPPTGAAKGFTFDARAAITQVKPGELPVGQFQAGVGYTVPKGFFEGTKATVTGTADTGGGYGATVGVSIPFDIGGGKKPKKSGERLNRWSDGSRPAGPQGQSAAAAPPSVDAVLEQPGTGLPQGVRGEMEADLGADFSRVRVHADDRAASSARDVGALAYTVGPHVVFGTGRWEPGTAAGRQVLAHELVHVVQQGAAPAAEKRP
ncbi:MAG: eCIS core domain-containing protein [Acidimicrobiales bacterium]